MSSIFIRQGNFHCQKHQEVKKILVNILPTPHSLVQASIVTSPTPSGLETSTTTGTCDSCNEIKISLSACNH
ncbi:hypothetical protein M8J77_015882 [Diaphorina citri]|nr:hypothetical protein M8J77_015882 [Diaphorina citri]